MKAPGVIAIVGGMGALALLGLAMLQRPEPAADPAPASPVNGRTPQAPSQPVPNSPPPPSPPRATAPVESAQQAPAERPAPGVVEPGPAAAGESASPAAPAAPAPPPVPVEVERMLTVARQSSDESERLRAVTWLGEHADLYQFEALQQIQMNDPDAAVRRAAEAAANALRERHADKPWPGIPQNADPRDYMRGVPEPSR